MIIDITIAVITIIKVTTVTNIIKIEIQHKIKPMKKLIYFISFY